jgi:hypothetical protein
MPDVNFTGLPFAEPDDTSIIAFVFVTVIYLALLFLTLFIARREFKLVLLGLLTAVATIGYAGLVRGGALLVTPTLMKLSVLLVLGGIAVQLLSRWDRPATVVEERPAEPGETIL